MLRDSLLARSNQCELCSASNNLTAFVIASPSRPGISGAVLVCEKCKQALEQKTTPADSHHWKCLSEAIWSEHVPVKVLTYRILHSYQQEAWASELMEQIYLEADDLQWAQENLVESQEASSGQSGHQPTLDSNGQVLNEGDSVTLIKDLEVKGGGFTAKRGSLVKNIRLTDNPEHIEGRVNGVHIVLVAKFLKKAL